MKRITLELTDEEIEWLTDALDHSITNATPEEEERGLGTLIDKINDALNNT